MRSGEAVGTAWEDCLVTVLGVGGVGEEKGRGPHRMSREENLSQGNENEEATSLENTPVP